ncbi:MAG: AMP-binding protein [Pseudomonadota bacterium]|nr:AMP-binding protein [Pseudomonadota bacterium]
MNRFNRIPPIHRALFKLKQPLLNRIKGMSVSKLMLNNAKIHPNQIALYHCAEDDYSNASSMTWKDIHQHACQLAAYFFSQNISNQTILIMARNRPEHYIADLACLYSNNIPASIYTSLTASQISDILKITHAKHIIVDAPSMYQHAQKSSHLCHHPIKVICIEKPKRLQKNAVLWKQAIQSGKHCLDSYHDRILKTIHQSKPADIACYIFTSGTTGKPKGAILSHENVIFAAAGVHTVGTQHIPNAKLVSYLPLAHVFERVVGYYGWIYSKHTIFCTWSVNDLKDALPSARPSIFVGVPRIYEKIEQNLMLKLAKSPLNWLFQMALNNGKKRNIHKQNNTPIPILIRLKHVFFSWLLFKRIKKAIGFDHCRLCLSGSAPLDPDVIDFFAALDLDIVEGYGLTENSAPATVSWNKDMFNNMSQFFHANQISFPDSPLICQYGRVGLPMPGTKVRIHSKTNLISIYGPHVFQRYLHDARSTSDTFDGKWLKTGDLGMIHPSGEIEIIGRKKDLIVLSNGKNIAPRKIEQAMSKHPLIAHLCLVGDGKAYLIAIICLRYDGGEVRYAKNHDIPYRNRQQFCKNVAVKKSIKAHIHKINQGFCRPEQIKYFHLTHDIWSSDNGQLTPTLKLKRAFLLDQYAKVTDKIYQEHDPTSHNNT